MNNTFLGKLKENERRDCFRTMKETFSEACVDDCLRQPSFEEILKIEYRNKYNEELPTDSTARRNFAKSFLNKDIDSMVESYVTSNHKTKINNLNQKRKGLEDKLEELTEEVNQKEQIVSDAKEKARKIITDAEEKAKKIKDTADAEAVDTKLKTASNVFWVGIVLAFFIGLLVNQITDLLNDLLLVLPCISEETLYWGNIGLSIILGGTVYGVYRKYLSKIRLRELVEIIKKFKTD